MIPATPIQARQARTGQVRGACANITNLLLTRAVLVFVDVAQ
ncbi:MAG TPA: hypothetical protein VKD24_05870 [Candidatus Angelobacter sp.]|nr:hypothetical protein [Candidatus Angelobacter sp.]